MSDHDMVSTAPGWRARSRSAALMYGAGALLGVFSSTVSASPDVQRPGFLVVWMVAAAAAAAALLLGPRFTLVVAHASTAGGSVLLAIVVAMAGGTFLSILYSIAFVWVAQYAAVFYSGRAARCHVLFASAVHAVSLSVLPADQRLATWAVITGTCQIVLICYQLSHRCSGRMRSLVEHSGAVVLLVDRELNVKFVDGPVGRVLGYDAAQFRAARLSEQIHPDDLPLVIHALSESIRSATRTSFEARMRRPGGGWLHAEVNVENALGNSLLGGIVLTLRDVSERKLLEEKLAYQAFHDPLTGLANRALFANRVEHALALRGADAPAVLFMDLDNFKDVNDGFGHAAGDAFLREVAHRLTQILREGDTAARLGGDEFAVLLEGDCDQEQAVAIGGRVLAALREPFAIDERALPVGASVGLVVGPPGDIDVDELLRHADAAMYAAKGRGKGCCHVLELTSLARPPRRFEAGARYARLGSNSAARGYPAGV